MKQRNKPVESAAERPARAKPIEICKKYYDNVKSFDVAAVVSNWWSNELITAKISFISALIIGFLTHIFFYTGRYFGNHDIGSILMRPNSVSNGRWFNKAIEELSYGYLIPLTSGLFITLSLAVSAFYICKIFNVKRKINAVIVAAFLTTFPAIANANLFFDYTTTIHFGVMLSVLAVYLTIRFKLGFFAGAVLLMFALAIYQTNLGIVAVLCIFYLLTYIIDKDYTFKTARNHVVRFSILGGLGSIFYAISLPVMFYIHNTNFSGQRGFDLDGTGARLGSVEGILNALQRTYGEFYDSFFGRYYVVVDELAYAFIALAGLAAIFFLIIVIKQKIYKQIGKMVLIFLLMTAIPFASNIAGFLATDTYGLMVYPFVLILIFFVIVSERCRTPIPILRSALVVCSLFIAANFIISTNVYYLRAYFFNQRFESLTTRIADRVDPLLPLVESPTKRITYFSPLPNEYYTDVNLRFLEFGSTDDGPLYHDSFVMMTQYTAFRRGLFINSLANLHGLNVQDLGDGEERERLRAEVLERNMPVWPAEGSVDIIDDIIVINFGVSDVIFEETDDGQFFRARHWISEGHAQHDYEYHWRVYRNGDYHFSTITNTSRLPFDELSADDNYRVQVSVRNATVGFNYESVFVELEAESSFVEFLHNAFSEDSIIILSVRDEASNALTDEIQRALHLLGLQESLLGMWRHSYAAIIDGHDVVFERISDERIDYTQNLGNLSIELTSAGWDAGDISSILVNGEEHSLNNRGINVVVIDRTTGNVIDSIAIDTFHEFLTVHRR